MFNLININQCIGEQDQFTKFYTVKLEECKQTINPYSLRNEIVKITGVKPKRIHTADKTSFTIEAWNESQSAQLTKISMIDGKFFITTPHKYYNQAKGVIYIQEYDVTNIGEFENGQKSKYNIAQVTRAEFIRTRN